MNHDSSLISIAGIQKRQGGSLFSFFCIYTKQVLRPAQKSEACFLYLVFDRIFRISNMIENLSLHIFRVDMLAVSTSKKKCKMFGL